MSSSSPRHRRSSAAARSSKASETPRAHKGSKAQLPSKRPTGTTPSRASKANRSFKGDRASKADRVSKAHEVSKVKKVSKAKQVSTARTAPQAPRDSKPKRAAKPKTSVAAQASSKAPNAKVPTSKAPTTKAQQVYRVAAPPTPPVAVRAPQPKRAVAAVAVVASVSPPPPLVTAPAARVALSCEELLARVVALIHERRGEEVVALDVRGLADYMDFLVIASGRSERQNRSIADGVMRGLKGLKVRPLARPGPEDGAWICLDFVDVVVHVFDSVTRSHYDLENLWGDAPHFPIAAPPAQLPPVPAGEPLAVYEAGGAP